MKKWLIPVICLVVLIIAAVATISYFLFFDNEEEERSGYEDITSWSDDYDAVEIDSVTKFKENMHVYFGSYEQDYNKKNGAEPIIWRVLDVEDDRVLLLSEYILDKKHYHDVDEPVTWESSSLRSWLNSTFYMSAFSAEERDRVLETTLENPDNPKYSVDGGVDTSDFVFVLSYEEICEYFDINWSYQKVAKCEECGFYVYNNCKLAAPITPYADKQEAPYLKGTSDCKHARYMGAWWVRTPGATEGHVMYVYYDNHMVVKGDNVYWASAAVRPAIWVSVD